MPRYSVIINWNDRDREQGTFSWSGIAADEHEAERMTREEMAASDLDADHEGEPISSEDTGGSVVEITHGAIWQAQELEDALRAILPYAESRAEDMEECAEANEEVAKEYPEFEEAVRTATRSRADADKAIAAVDAAKALLASLDGEV